MKRKAQISLETIIILGLLVLLAIILVAVLLDTFGTKVESTSQTDQQITGITDGFIDDLNNYNVKEKPKNTISIPDFSKNKTIDGFF